MSLTQTRGTLDADSCYPALLARDARFDGRWFVGVTSTGVYCRPICRVRTPKLENCRFFGSAAQAEAQAFRPCMKCRPELAPRAGEDAWSAMDASRTLARQAAAWLDRCDDAEASVEQLADVIGVSSRHLRRIFMAEHGVTPLQYLQTRRLLLAKHLLTDSTMPISQVALAAGFASLRRFNAAFVAHYRMQPTALRKEGQDAQGPAAMLRLAYREPYDVDGVLAFLLPRAVPGVERVDVPGAIVQRTVSLVHGGREYRGWLQAQFGLKPGQVCVHLSAALWPAVGSLLPLLRRWLDLDADPQGIALALGEGAAPGQRLPGCTDRFELAVRAVLGQQVTVAAARTLSSRFVERFGEMLVDAPPGADRLFPSAARIAGELPERIAELGIIRRRADSIVEIARRWPELRYANGEGAPDEAAAELQGIAGIGPWTAHYMLMRGWSWPDAFPPGDVALRKALGHTDDTPLSPRAYLAAAERYRPYRSYAVLHLWRSL